MRGKPRGARLLLATFVGTLTCSQAIGQTVGSIIQAEERRIEQAQAQQDEIDGIVSTTRQRFDEYQGLLKEIEGLQIYNNLLQAQIDDQNQQLDELRTSIDQVSVIERQVLPLMTRMIDSLERFIELDIPFLLEERRERVSFLRNLINRSDVTSAEQFRFVMEAWQIEMSDYGRNSETYTDVIEVDGATREVQLLKIGRTALVYLTPDGGESGAWDPQARQWVRLDSSFNQEISDGIEAVSTNTPALFSIPVSPPEEG